MDGPRIIQGDHSLLTPENKERWFHRLTPAERLDLLAEYLSFVTDLNPRLREHHAPDLSRPVRVLRLPQG